MVEPALATDRPRRLEPGSFAGLSDSSTISRLATLRFWFQEGKITMANMRTTTGPQTAVCVTAGSIEPLVVRAKMLLLIYTRQREVVRNKIINAGYDPDAIHWRGKLNNWVGDLESTFDDFQSWLAIGILPVSQPEDCFKIYATRGEYLSNPVLLKVNPPNPEKLRSLLSRRLSTLIG